MNFTSPAQEDPAHNERPGTISRRTFLVRAVGFGLALPAAGGLLAACGGAAPSAPAAATAAPAAGATVAAAAPTAASAAGTAVSVAPTVMAEMAPTIAAAATQMAPAVEGAATQAAAAVATAAPGVGAGDKIMVSILNKEMTRDEIIAGIQAEGEVNIANWNFTANDAIVGRFQDVVKEEWGVDIKCNYLPSQQPSIYLTNLYTANSAGNPAPYDVLAIEENYYAEAKANNIVQDIFPSGLMPNYEPVDAAFKRGNQAVAFQATAFPIVIHTTDWFQDWRDLADPRLKGKITIQLPGDIGNGGHLIGLAWAMGLDYKKPEDMVKVVDFMVNDIFPNALKVTSEQSEMGQLLRSGAAEACCFWNSLARLENLSGAPGTENTKYTLPPNGSPVINGYAWVGKGVPHPLLAQIFINWRISTDGMIPSDKWPSAPGAGPANFAQNRSPFSEMFEGVLYEEMEKSVPEWYMDVYQKYYPQYKDYGSLKQVDWDYYAANQKTWQDDEQRRIGL